MTGIGEEKPAPSLETLKKRSQFLAVAATGKRWVCPFFILQVGSAVETAVPPISCGFTTSKKVGKAVQRNRARRRLRALAREILAVHADPARSYVLVGRDSTPEAPFAAMRDELIRGMKRLGLWRD